MCSVLMLDYTIMNLFTDSTKQSTQSHQKLFFPETRMILFTCANDIYRILYVKEEIQIQKGQYVHIITLKKIRKYLPIILSIDNDEADLRKKTNQFINDKSDFNNKQHELTARSEERSAHV